MARPRIQFQLQQPGLRPVASPVDTFAQPNPVPPEEAVTNEWLELAKGLSALSPELSDFLVGIEEETRKESAAEAQAAMEAFDGDASIFASLPRSTGKEAEAWFEANKDAFGGSEFRYAARPDFQLAFQVAQGRWEVNQNKRFQLEDGTPVTYRDYLYSHADELSDPNSDARQKVEEWRKEFFEGLDPTKSIAYREGVISAAAPMESQFLNTVEARQVAAADALTRQASVDELMLKFDEHRRLNVSVSERPASEDETPAEAARREEANQRIREDNSAREQALRAGIVDILDGPQFIGGISKNKVLFEALDTMARVTQADTDDELEAEEFLEWAKTLPGLDTAYWQGRFEEIQSNIEIRERQRGKEDGLSTLPEIRNQAQWRAYNILKDSGATTLEEALGVLRQPENQAQFEEMLSSNKLSNSELEALIGGSAESFVARKEGTGYPTSKEGIELRDDLNRRIALEGATPEIMALLESPETQELLGGTEPRGAWAGLLAAYEDKEKEGFRDRDFEQRGRVSFGQVIPQGERGQYSPGDQAFIEELELDFLEELRARSTGVDDPDERRRIAKTLEREFKQRPDILDLKDRNYRVAPGLLYDKGLPTVRGIVDAEIGQLFPLTKDIVNEADPTATQRGVPIPNAYADRAEAQLEIKQRVQPYIRTLSDHLDQQGETDISRRNEFIESAIIRGFTDREAGLQIPKLREVIELYASGSQAAPAAPDVTPPAVEAPERTEEPDRQARATAIQLQKSESILKRLVAPDKARVVEYGATAIPDSTDRMNEWAAGTVAVLSSKERDASVPKSEEYITQFRDVHSHGEVVTYSSLGIYPGATSLDPYYPTPNDFVLIYSSALLLDPNATQPTDWWDNGDFMSDVGVDFNQYSGNRQALQAKYLAAKINKGLTVDEIRLGRTIEGVPLEDFWPDRTEQQPIASTLIGPQDPAEFRRYIQEYRDADDPSSTDLGYVMDWLGIVADQPISATDSTTHGEKYIEVLENLMQARIEAMPEQQAVFTRRYKDIPRMRTKRKGLYESVMYHSGMRSPEQFLKENASVPFDDADERFYSPAQRSVLQQEVRFYADLKRLNSEGSSAQGTDND